ncbi:MAG: Gfo/Idh/MocA family oxidoreductase [Clostridia bacterium]|nr:Gfo/Idh/MocA family oxidoreductase [Clostridia bacterium]
MKKIVFLGCENSHANQFLDYVKGIEKYSDIEVVGVYSDEIEAAKRLGEKYGLYVMRDYGELAGKVDGVVVTARHGDNHYKFAKPYLESGVPVFVDKPITVKEDDAVAFMRECKKYGVKFTGGSCLKYVDVIRRLKKSA